MFKLGFDMTTAFALKSCFDMYDKDKKGTCLFVALPGHHITKWDNHVPHPSMSPSFAGHLVSDDIRKFYKSFDKSVSENDTRYLESQLRSTDGKMEFLQFAVGAQTNKQVASFVCVSVSGELTKYIRRVHRSG